MKSGLTAARSEEKRLTGAVGREIGPGTNAKPDEVVMIVDSGSGLRVGSSAAVS